MIGPTWIFPVVLFRSSTPHSAVTEAEVFQGLLGDCPTLCLPARGEQHLPDQLGCAVQSPLLLRKARVLGALFFLAKYPGFPTFATHSDLWEK